MYRALHYVIQAQHQIIASQGLLKLLICIMPRLDLLHIGQQDVNSSYIDSVQPYYCRPLGHFFCSVPEKVRNAFINRSSYPPSLDPRLGLENFNTWRLGLLVDIPHHHSHDVGLRQDVLLARCRHHVRR